MKNKTLAILYFALGIVFIGAIGYCACINHDKIDFGFDAVFATTIFIILLYCIFKDAWKKFKEKEKEKPQPTNQQAGDFFFV